MYNLELRHIDFGFTKKGTEYIGYLNDVFPVYWVEIVDYDIKIVDFKTLRENEQVEVGGRIYKVMDGGLFKEIAVDPAVKMDEFYNNEYDGYEYPEDDPYDTSRFDERVLL